MCEHRVVYRVNGVRRRPSRWRAKTKKCTGGNCREELSKWSQSGMQFNKRVSHFKSVFFFHFPAVLQFNYPLSSMEHNRFVLNRNFIGSQLSWPLFMSIYCILIDTTPSSFTIHHFVPLNSDSAACLRRSTQKKKDCNRWNGEMHHTRSSNHQLAGLPN